MDTSITCTTRRLYWGISFIDYSDLTWEQAASFCASHDASLLSVSGEEEERHLTAMLVERHRDMREIVPVIYLGLVSEKQVKYYVLRYVGR